MLDSRFAQGCESSHARIALMVNGDDVLFSWDETSDGQALFGFSWDETSDGQALFASSI